MTQSVIHDIIIALRDDNCLPVPGYKRRYMSDSVIHDIKIAVRDGLCLTVSYTI